MNLKFPRRIVTTLFPLSASTAAVLNTLITDIQKNESNLRIQLE